MYQFFGLDLNHKLIIIGDRSDIGAVKFLYSGSSN